MEPIEWAAMGLKLKNFGGKLLKSKWLYVILAVLAVGVGTYAYLNHSTKQAVSTAVQNADAHATIDTFKTKEQAEAALVPLNEKAEAKAEQTRKDYSSARQQVYSHPIPQRTETAPRIVIDTLNDLDRLSRSREDADGVPAPVVRSK